ncbi:hypothetical protein I79_021418 [Cricetulus griseus]|uniref:Uncharacterized protein n=1 Tax=Cricetulus griseus TaxID=10029 RepID=G3ICM0_CRIGR|nr:hypothetical protein I79_021418 [Cricetulus griseus]
MNETNKICKSKSQIQGFSSQGGHTHRSEENAASCKGREENQYCSASRNLHRNRKHWKPLLQVRLQSFNMLNST